MNLKYLIPNFFTFTSLIISLISIEIITNGNFLLACWLITLCMLFDMLDGKIARKLNAFSPFGAELDSLVDVVCFGVAPSMLVYYFVLEPLGFIGKFAIIFYMITATYRLARFNSTLSSDLKIKRSFSGLPITSAAGFLVAYVIFSIKIPHNNTPIYCLFFVIFVSLLMLSKTEFAAFDMQKNQKVKFYLILLTLAIAIKFSYIVYFLSAVVYISYNILRHFIIAAHQHKIDKLRHN